MSKNDEALVPRPQDYSALATNRSIRSEMLLHPATTAPAAVGVVALIALLALPFVPPLVMGLLTLGGLGAGTLHFLAQYYGRRDTHAIRYHQRLHRRFEQLHEQALERLMRDLADRVESPRGFTQLNQVRDKFANLKRVLERRLNEGELAYSRYLGAAEAVYQSVLQNLEQVVTILIALSDVDPERLRRKIRELEAMRDRKSEHEQELVAFKQRLEIYDREMRKVGQLLARNEEALTGLDNASIQITKIESGDTGAGTNLRHAMEDLARLARLSERPADELSFELPGSEPQPTERRIE